MPTPWPKNAPLVEHSLHDGKGENAPPNSKPVLTERRMHPVTNYAPSTLKDLNNAYMYVVDHIVRLINTKDSTRNIIC